MSFSMTEWWQKYAVTIYAYVMEANCNNEDDDYDDDELDQIKCF